MGYRTIEKNSDYFVKACEKYADEKYFNECAKSLDKLDFAVESKGKPNKDSWLGLYKHPIKGKLGFCDSSDNIKIGDLFYEFLSDSFPGKDSEEEFTLFIRSVYGDEVCEDLGWLYKKLERNSLPHPKFEIDAMEEEDIFGMHEGESITLNQRLALNALSSENIEDHFTFFLTLLNEYGHFLNFLLHEEAKKPMGDSKMTGRIFAYRFMKYSSSDLFNADFEYADFLIPDAAMEGEHKLTLGVSGLSHEQRWEIFYRLCTDKIWEGEV